MNGESRVDSPAPRRLAAGVFLAALVFGLATVDSVGIVWYEPFFWEKSRRIDRWYRDLGAGPETRAAALSEAGLKAAWPFCVQPPDENPPVYCIVSHLTWRLG
ncbi:MAG TPA: hypothetical protein VNC50_22370, partial [Planctomycetia bacterium]|nr:hypothetical protein [Planctomycetia bacterium]